MNTSVTRTRGEPVIVRVTGTEATIWLAHETWPDADYYYGGTRLVDPAASEEAVTDGLLRLMEMESATKNRLIDWALRAGIVDDLRHRLPSGFRDSQVGGARCLIRPRTPEVAEALTNPSHPCHDETTDAVLRRVGDVLGERAPRVKLTPDFGRFAGLADVLHRYTPNVLGIRCDRGGCGGKSSYAVTGVLAAADRFHAAGITSSVTCIGSAGAMGTGVLRHFLDRAVEDLAACDLSYDAPGGACVPEGCRHIRSQSGSFTAECLRRGGLIVATTVGDELAGSPLKEIPSRTTLLLAHNLAFPPGEHGIEIARGLASRHVTVLPGQTLTLGGALTARLEWFWRQLPGNPPFDKALAHDVVRRVAAGVNEVVIDMAASAAITPYEAMLRLAAQGRRGEAVSRVSAINSRSIS